MVLRRRAGPGCLHLPRSAQRQQGRPVTALGPADLAWLDRLSRDPATGWSGVEWFKLFLAAEVAPVTYSGVAEALDGAIAEQDARRTELLDILTPAAELAAAAAEGEAAAEAEATAGS